MVVAQGIAGGVGGPGGVRVAIGVAEGVGLGPAVDPCRRIWTVCVTASVADETGQDNEGSCSLSTSIS